MTWRKRGLCLLLILSLLALNAFSEEEQPTNAPAPEVTEAAPEPTKKPEPTQEPKQEATSEPTNSPTKEPSNDPTNSPTNEPSSDPTNSPTNEPSSDPTNSPTNEPSNEPTNSPTNEPSSDPTNSPTNEPPQEPTPEPSSELSISIDGQYSVDEQGAYVISVQNAQSEIRFTWTSVAGAENYAVRISAEDGDEKLYIVTEERSLRIQAADYFDGAFTLRIAAMAGEAELKNREIRFSLRLAEQQRPEGGFPNGFPMGGFGGFRGGSRSGAMNMMGQMEVQGFRIVPGEAFASSHASGSKDMRLYAAVEAEPSEAAMRVLTMGGETLDVSLENGGEFSAAVEEDCLTLAGDGAWRISLYALKTLKNSGIARLRLGTDGDCTLSTELALSGGVYGALRSEGFVLKDFILIVDSNEIRVEVDGRLYRLTEGVLEQIV